MIPECSRCDPRSDTGAVDDEPTRRTRHVVVLLLLAALVNLPLIHATLTGAHVQSDDVLIVTVVVDAFLVVIALLLWRYGGRVHPRLRAIALEDVERCAPGSVLEQVDGETYLVRGEVTGIEEGRLVLAVGDRSVLVYLDGHRNPVGYQQPAQVRARLL